MYISQLEVEDIRKLYTLIKLYDKNDPTKRLHYKVISDIFIYNPKKLKPTETLFIRNFSCSLPKADRETIDKINAVYRAYMASRFDDYQDNLQVYLDRKNSKNNLNDSI